MPRLGTDPMAYVVKPASSPHWYWAGPRHSKDLTPVWHHNPDGSIRPGQRAARVVYTRERGPLPHTLAVVRSCDDPMCVNPAHAWLRPTRRRR